MTWLLGLILVAFGAEALWGEAASVLAIGALLCARVLFDRWLLAHAAALALSGRIEGEAEPEPERGHGGRMAGPWN